MNESGVVEAFAGIRTGAAIPVEVPILEVQQPPRYQKIAPKAKHLAELGMAQTEIGRRLGIDRWTIGMALRWFREVRGE